MLFVIFYFTRVRRYHLIDAITLKIDVGNVSVKIILLILGRCFREVTND